MSVVVWHAVSPTEEFRIRRATPGDRESIIALVSEMFGSDVAPRYDWLYRSNPHGAALSWLAVDRDDAAVAVTSVFPRRVMVRGRQRVGSIGGDCYVLPRARRRGLATRLHQASLAEMSDGGVDFMYGPPLPNNLKALVRAGSTDVGVFRRFSRPLTWDAALKGAFGTGASRAIRALGRLPMRVLTKIVDTSLCNVDVDDVTEFSGEFDDLWQRSNRPAAVCPVRDREFLTWRYLAPSPCTQEPLAIRRGGELVAFAAFESHGDEAILVDLFAIDRPAWDAGFQIAVDRARQRSCAHVDFYVTPGGVDPWLLRRHGFFAREHRGFQVAVPDGESQRDALIDPASWYFTEGDKDMPTSFSDLPA